jgi:hypothetical protein
MGRRTNWEREWEVRAKNSGLGLWNAIFRFGFRLAFYGWVGFAALLYVFTWVLRHVYF